MSHPHSMCVFRGCIRKESLDATSKNRHRRWECDMLGQTNLLLPTAGTGKALSPMVDCRVWWTFSNGEQAEQSMGLKISRRLELISEVWQCYPMHSLVGLHKKSQFELDPFWCCQPVQLPLESREHFLSEWVINTWNSLDSEIVESGTLNTFKWNYRSCTTRMSHSSNVACSLDSRGRASPPGEASTGILLVCYDFMTDWSCWCRYNGWLYLLLKPKF